MVNKMRVAVLFGGQSGEHEVSLISASSVINHLDKNKYEIYFLGITKGGQWKYFEGDAKRIQDGSWEADARPAVFPGDPSFGGFFLTEAPDRIYKVDMVFPVLHGPRGEDGTVQGLLELSGIPYVGCGVLASSTGMDKAASKAIFRSLGLPQGEYVSVLMEDWKENSRAVAELVEGSFGYPCFVKPANMGSSVGISKARSREELAAAMEYAGRYDSKIIIEALIDCREIECAVLGNNRPKASVLGEIIPSKEFYDYEAKYNDGGSSRLLVPAVVDKDKAEEIRDLAVRAYRALCCSGLSRVDFFMEKGTGRVYINEVNTLPGFTSISMYPKLWEASGIPYGELLDTLIELALESYKVKRR